MSYGINNQGDTNTISNYKYIGKHVRRITVNKIVDFKEEKLLMYTRANIQFAEFFDSIIFYCMTLKMF